MREKMQRPMVVSTIWFDLIVCFFKSDPANTSLPAELLACPIGKDK
jgi:hypothetical protein